MNERTLILLKPDAVQRGLIGDIISRFEKCCLKIVGMKLVYPTKDQAGKHYIDDEEWLLAVGNKSLTSAKEKGQETPINDAREIGLKIRALLMDYLCMSPVVALVLEGHGAVAKVRKIVGPTNPQDALPGTIRGDYTIDSYRLSDHSNRPIQNLVHASGTKGEAEREITVWFKPEELCAWKRVDEDLIYRKG